MLCFTQRSSLLFLLFLLIIIAIVSNIRLAPSAAYFAPSSQQDAYENNEAPPAMERPSAINMRATAATITAEFSIQLEEGEMIRNSTTAEAREDSKSTADDSSPPQTMPPSQTAKQSPISEGDDHSLFFQNSKQWLDGNRLSNIDSEDLDFVLSQIFKAEELLTGNASHLLDRSLCHADSRVRNPTFHNWNATDQHQIKEWTFLLIYLAIHVWHHEPAKEEALARMRQQQQQRQQNSSSRNNTSSMAGINNYDYECPSAKFMITTIPSSGLGAALRMSAIYSILTGIAIKRIPIFLSSVPSGKVHEKLHAPFLLGYAPRFDLQSAFLPTTPCVVTMENVERDMVTMLTGGADERKLRRKGSTRNRTVLSARYLYVPGKMTPEKDGGIWAKAMANIHATAKDLVDRMRKQQTSSDGNAEQFRVWDKALEQIRRNDFSFDQIPSESSVGFAPFRSATLMYLLRLNREQQRQVQQGVQDTLPTNFDPLVAIGVPIRGSDKCRRESTCLTFDKYMQLANETIKQYGYNTNMNGTATRPTVVITTEDSSVANASRHYQSKEFPIIMNEADAQQDTGRPSNYKYKRQSESIMRSSLIALTLQMYPTHTYGNCCSNFHQVLFDLLASNCGLNKKRMCLMDHPDPTFRVCCLWDEERCGMNGAANTTVEVG